MTESNPIAGQNGDRPASWPHEPAPAPPLDWPQRRWQPPEPEPAPPTRRRPRWVVVVAILVALALAAGLIAAASGGAEDSAAPTPTTATSSPQPSTSTPPTSVRPPDPRDPVIAELLAFVEQQRGREFLASPPVLFVDETAFRARVRSVYLNGFNRSDLETETLRYRSLGLLGSDESLLDLERDSTGIGQFALYDYQSERLLVLDRELSPLVRAQIVGELTFAFDDQHFDLGRTELNDLTPDAFYAVLAVVQGDVRRVRNAYVASLDTDGRAAYDAEQGSVSAEFNSIEYPDWYVEILAGPAQLGEELLAAREGRGEDAIDELIVDPPETFLQIWDATALVDDRQPQDPPTPEAPVAAVESGRLGVIVLFALLAEVVEVEEGFRLIGGWEGDQYTVWTEPGLVCIELHVATTGGDAPRDLSAALTEFAETRSLASVSVAEAGDLVQWSSCAESA